MYKRYLKRLINLLSCSFVLIVICNIVIDPYAIFNFPVLHSLNTEKPALIHNLRALKLYEIKKKRPQSLILGTSRAQVGLSCTHRAFSYPAYNVGLPLATIDEIWDYFSYARNLAQIKQVVLAVDFFSFNAYLKTLSPFRTPFHEHTKADPFVAKDKIAAIIGWSGLKGSIETIIYNRKRFRESFGTYPDLASSQIKAKARFEKNERFYLEKKIYKPYPQKDYAFNEGSYHPFEYYRKILQMCHDDSISCRIIILPIHARQLELIYLLGLWDHFEAWKRMLVSQAKAINPNFLIYDFTGFANMHTEKVPEIDARDQHMQWFVDSAHITPRMGERILDKVLLSQDLEDGFGVMLTEENIKGHLQKIREQRARFERLSPHLVKEMQSMIDHYS